MTRIKALALFWQLQTAESYQIKPENCSCVKNSNPHSCTWYILMVPIKISNVLTENKTLEASVSMIQIKLYFANNAEFFDGRS